MKDIIISNIMAISLFVAAYILKKLPLRIFAMWTSDERLKIFTKILLLTVTIMLGVACVIASVKAWIGK